jgi:hypothetical protein
LRFLLAKNFLRVKIFNGDIKPRIELAPSCFDEESINVLEQNGCPIAIDSSQRCSERSHGKRWGKGQVEEIVKPAKRELVKVVVRHP